MQMIRPDFSEAIDMSPIPPGKYRARIINAEYKVSKKSGDPYLNWKLEVSEPETKQTGKEFYHITMIKGKGTGVLKQFVSAVLNEEVDFSNFEFDPSDFYGRELMVTLQKKVDQEGKESKYPEVFSVLPLE